MLSDEEIQNILTHDCATEFYLATDYIEAGTKSQLKKVVEWGDEDCPHLTTTGGTLPDRKTKPQRKRECWTCRQPLSGEVK